MSDSSSQSSRAPIHGLLLAGGKSRRMGRDKATLQYAPDALPLWQSTTLLLQQFCHQVHISLRPDQQPPALSPKQLHPSPLPTSDLPPPTTDHRPPTSDPRPPSPISALTQAPSHLRTSPSAKSSPISHLPSSHVPACQTITDSLPSVGPLTGILSAMKAFPDVAWLVVACDLPLLDAETIRYLIQHRTDNGWATAYRSSHDGLPEPLCTIYEPSARSVLEKYIQNDLRCPRKILINEAAHVQLLDLPNPNALANSNTPEDFQHLSSPHPPALSSKQLPPFQPPTSDLRPPTSPLHHLPSPISHLRAFPRAKIPLP